MQPALSFSPDRDYQGARAKGCFTCAHWLGRFANTHIICERNAPFLHVPGQPKNGCAFWMRATGGDDE